MHFLSPALLFFTTLPGTAQLQLQYPSELLTGQVWQLLFLLPLSGNFQLPENQLKQVTILFHILKTTGSSEACNRSQQNQLSVALMNFTALLIYYQCVDLCALARNCHSHALL